MTVSSASADERQRERGLEAQVAAERAGGHRRARQVVLEGGLASLERRGEHRRGGTQGDAEPLAVRDAVPAEDHQPARVGHEHRADVEAEQRRHLAAHEPRDALRVDLGVDRRRERREPGADARGVLELLEGARLVDQVRRLVCHALHDAEPGLVESRRAVERHEERSAIARAERHEAHRPLLERLEQGEILGRRRAPARGVADATGQDVVAERYGVAVAARAAPAEVQLLREALHDVRRRAAVRRRDEALRTVAVEVGRRPAAGHQLDGEPSDAVEDAVQIEALHLQQGLGHPPLALQIRDLRERCGICLRVSRGHDVGDSNCRSGGAMRTPVGDAMPSPSQRRGGTSASRHRPAAGHAGDGASVARRSSVEAA